MAFGLRKLGLFIVVAGLLGGIVAGDAKAAPPRAPEPIKLDVSYATVLWHGYKSQALPDAEMLAMFNIRLDSYDEFSRRKVFQKAKDGLARRETRVKRSQIYSFTMRRHVGEYDFGAKGFPIDIPIGPIGLPAGKYQYPSTTCQGFTSDTAVYRAWVESPATISFRR